MTQVLWFNEVANITFTEGQLLDMQTDLFSDSPAAATSLLKNLTSSGCSAPGAILPSINAIENSSDNPPTNFVITQSNFSNLTSWHHQHLEHCQLSDIHNH